MKKSFYLPFLSILFLIGCSSDDDVNSSVDPDPDPIEETPYYEVPDALADYYEAIEFSEENEELYDDLAALTIAKHSNMLDYTDRHDYLYKADEDPAKPDNVVLIYTGESRYWEEYLSGGNNYEPQTFNTEHVYPQSLVDNTAKGDLHHLRAADVQVNQTRGNYPFTDGEGSYKLVDGNKFFPGDEWRGDVARMIMYMNLRYDEPFNEIGGLELFLEWNAEDPVSALELQRNEVIYDAQGNRNPFIDNPHLATRLWGGDEAQNRWNGEPVEEDNEAPSAPQALTVSEIGYETLDLSWEAATDNIGVNKYNVMLDGESVTSTSSTSITLADLTPGTTYSITVAAVDAAGNVSEESDAVEATTNEDTEAPTTPANLAVGTVTSNSVSLSWDASTDNVEVKEYDLFLDGEYNATTTNTEFTIAGLEAETQYSFTVLARDIYDNESAQSAAVEATTTEETENGGGTSAELFFSEYVEGGGVNKAVEIANITGEEVDLSAYSIQKQVNGNGEWSDAYALEGTLASGDVFVISNGGADIQAIIDASDVSLNGAPVDFNGDDPVGLFKDGVLIDMIGVDGDVDFGKDVTLRRKSTVTAPNTTYTEDEWEVLAKDTVDGLGTY
ncbi:endonuclease [Salinimicrobium sp. TIG7-5_MAKvit]|uniref:endonuclease n=1 Tax=Salinimicrobium sp. TIG7-5_MAKvit TaxID=3121289 RepID=UPI003C6DD263